MSGVAASGSLGFVSGVPGLQAVPEPPVLHRLVSQAEASVSALERALSPLNIRDGGVFINRAWPTANMLLAQPLAVRAEIARELLSVGDAG